MINNYGDYEEGYAHHMYARVKKVLPRSTTCSLGVRYGHRYLKFKSQSVGVVEGWSAEPYMADEGTRGKNMKKS